MSPFSQRLIITTLFSFAISATPVASAEPNHAFFTPQQMKWVKDMPDSLPKGAEMVILEGNPSQEEPFTLRLKFPANYRIPPHWHPVIEHLTIISGDFYLGMGDTIDEKKAVRLPTGSFAYMPPEMHHYAFTHKPVIVQLHGNGPWGITYVNPQDDPRNNKKTS